MKKILQAPAAIIISGLCWYFSCDLTGDYWYLLWFAPVPVLLVAFQVSGKQAFVVAFIAYLAGRLSWLSYLLTVLPVALSIFFTIFLPLVFALIVVLTRKIVLANWQGSSAFAFPLLWSSFEFILFKFAPDGTAGSIAYSQANFLPIVQVASVTGILGITFLVTLFPSVVATAIYYHRNKNIYTSLSVILSIIIISLLYGVTRVSVKPVDKNEITAGLAVLDEKFHSETNDPKAPDEIQVAVLYAEQVANLAKQGAEVAVLAEKIINITPGTDPAITRIFSDAAIKNHITVIAGFTRFKDDVKENDALVISPEGKVIADYTKVNLFEGEARNRFKPGKEISIFTSGNTISGVAICKDLDFQSFIRKYSANDIQVLYVPAWDFIKDGWLHSRMAILRSVENGFALIRTARQGNLTISNYRGEVLYEAGSTNNNAAVLTGKISLHSTKTIYSRFGDWFGYMNIIAALYFMQFAIRKKPGSKG